MTRTALGLRLLREIKWSDRGMVTIELEFIG